MRPCGRICRRYRTVARQRIGSTFPRLWHTFLPLGPFHRIAPSYFASLGSILHARPLPNALFRLLLRHHVSIRRPTPPAPPSLCYRVGTSFPLVVPHPRRHSDRCASIVAPPLGACACTMPGRRRAKGDGCRGGRSGTRRQEKRSRRRARLESQSNVEGRRQGRKHVEGGRRKLTDRYARRDRSSETQPSGRDRTRYVGRHAVQTSTRERRGRWWQRATTRVPTERIWRWKLLWDHPRIWRRRKRCDTFLRRIIRTTHRVSQMEALRKGEQVHGGANQRSENAYECHRGSGRRRTTSTTPN